MKLSDADLAKILKCIESIFNKKRVTNSTQQLISKKLIFYQQEIVRYKNTINFITNKTLRSLNQTKVDEILLAAFRLLTFTHFYDIENEESIFSKLKSLTYSNSPKYAVEEFLEQLKSFSWEIALKNKDRTSKMSIRYSIPSFFINRLEKVMDIPYIIANAEAMDAYPTQGISSMYILKNRIDISDSEIISKLEQNGVEFEHEFPFRSVYIFRNSQKRDIIISEFYKNGVIELLDPISFLTGDLLDPDQNDIIGDLCAAPGTKTSVMQHLSNLNSKIFATDYHFERLHQIIERRMKYANNTIHLINCDAANYPIRCRGLFDKILLDAPCTGSGTFGSNPELKWRQNHEFLARNVDLQKKLLNQAFELLKPNGTLVYSVCSMYREEGEMQIMEILDKFELCEIPEVYPKCYPISEEIKNNCIRFNPNKFGTKGFFLAKLRKRRTY